MQFQAIDTTTYYVFLAFGIILTASGLALIFRKPTDANAARLELFGLKFQASSAGTLVLLIGVGLLLLPLVVPRSDASSGGAVIDNPSPPNAGEAALILPQSADATEVESNDTIGGANQFALGFGVKGEINKERDDFSDWFIVDTSSVIGEDLRVQIRSPWGGCRVIAFDLNEEEIDDVYCKNGGSGNFTFFNRESDRIYLRVVFNNGSAAKRAEYELFLSAN